MFRQKLLFVGGFFQLLFQKLHPAHGVQHRREGIAHLAVDILPGVQLAVLFQIAQGHAPGQMQFPLVRLILTAEQFQQGGLAGAVFPHDANALPLLHRGVDPLQDHRLAEAFSDVL